MIVITTMDALPDYCYECPCNNGEHSQCEADKEKRSTFEYRPYWCPLKEVTVKPDMEKVIKGLEICINRVPGEYSCAECPYEIYGNDCEIRLSKDILALLKEQREEIENLKQTAQSMMEGICLLKEREGYVSVPFSWLVKFCTHIDFVEPLTDAEREVAWRQKLRQQFGINASKRGEANELQL